MKPTYLLVVLTLAVLGAAAGGQEQPIIDPAKADADFAVQGEYVGELVGDDGKRAKWGIQEVAGWLFIRALNGLMLFPFASALSGGAKRAEVYRQSTGRAAPARLAATGGSAGWVKSNSGVTPCNRR